MRVSFTVRDSVRVIQVAILSCNCEVTQPRRNKNTSEKSRIIVLILLTLLVCHLLAPRGGRLVGNKSGHSYSFTSPTNDL